MIFHGSNGTPDSMGAYYNMTLVEVSAKTLSAMWKSKEQLSKGLILLLERVGLIQSWNLDDFIN